MARPTFEEVFTKAGLIPQWIEQGIAQGLERGHEQGEEKKAFEIARRMKVMGFSEAQIIAAAGLSPEDIAGL